MQCAGVQVLNTLGVLERVVGVHVDITERKELLRFLTCGNVDDGKSTLIGPRSDVYALDAILYEALTSRPPFRAATPPTPPRASSASSRRAATSWGAPATPLSPHTPGSTRGERGGRLCEW